MRRLIAGVEDVEAEAGWSTCLKCTGRLLSTILRGIWFTCIYEMTFSFSSIVCCCRDAHEH